MIERSLKKEISHSLKNFPVVGIIGSRQVGKTTLAKHLLKGYPNALYIDLELPSDNLKLYDPELFFTQNTDSLIIIDEIQRSPNLYPIIRAVVDQNRKPGRFLILGSASPDLIRQSSESLAGRIIYHELTGFTITEIKGIISKANHNLWLRGNYPLSYLAKSEDTSFKWRNSFIQSFLERDIPQLGIRIPSQQMRRFWTMVAHNHGRLWNASEIAKSLSVSPPTAKSYLDILTDTFVIRQLQPYSTNTKKRVIKSPKTYLRDTGILHALLHITNYDELISHPVVGFSWEGFAIEQIINTTKDRYQVYFYRTNAGAEIDLVLAKGNTPKIAIEIKFGLSPTLSKSFWNAYSDFHFEKAFVVYSGTEKYKIKKNVEVISLNELINELLN